MFHKDITEKIFSEMQANKKSASIQQVEKLR